MTTTADNISVVLSGGAININPNASLGGDPSSSPILTSTLNNLFDDVSPEESLAGHEDYRCIYVFNDGDTSVYQVKLWVAEDFNDGSTIQIGFENRNEAQRITISGDPVTGGLLRLSYKGTEFETNYNADLAEWSVELQSTLESLTDTNSNKYFKEVAVTAQSAAGSTIFDIRFTGKDAKRNMEKIERVDNELESSGSVEVIITVPQEGAPINTIASELDVDTTPPGSVSFLPTSEASPLTLPRLDPEDGFPLWIKRATSSGTPAKELDGFILRIRLGSLES